MHDLASPPYTRFDTICSIHDLAPHPHTRLHSTCSIHVRCEVV
jgi:hypothetical protein